ncbi:DUF2514 family protein [Burkholderia cepacia]|uniref:DUF2514 family protein n=1 Tax=Burkholderia cepacia TaxID=292 RepID=UPI0005A201AD|nr:DUF2514 family protein [Burkholderia cepacia]
MTWLDPRIWLAVLVAMFVGIVAGYADGHRDADQSAKVADQEKQIEDLMAERDEFRRRLVAQQEIATDAAKQRDEALHARAAADGAADVLRKQVAVLVADVRSAGASAGSPATGDALDLLADVLGRSDETSGELAKIADDRGIAGKQCERDYDALTSIARK